MTFKRMIYREDLINFISTYLGKDLVAKALNIDVVANGVQFRGKSEVEKIALGVSLNEEWLKKAADWGAQVCILHHGFDPRSFKSCFPTFSQKRLKVILGNDLTVVGLHYLLDAHPEIGNNATIIKRLGAKIVEPLFEDWGFTGIFDEPQEIEKLEKECKKLFEHEIFSVLSGPKMIRKIGVVTGAGKPDAGHLAEMEAKGVQLYISGETAESVPHKMKESGINYFVCGHYATEVFGIQELGKKIKSHFGEKVEVKFINVENII